MRSVVAVILGLTALAGTRNQALAQSCEPPPGDLLVEIQEHFPAARKWFGMVSSLEWDRAPDGTLSPRLEDLHARFVLEHDPAGQALEAKLPPVASGPHRVALRGAPDLGVRTEELGVAAVPAEVLRGVVVYRNAVAGGDLLYKVTPTHVDEYLYLRAPPAGLYRELEFDVGRGVARLREAGRLIEVIGKDGAAHLRLSAPVARAADGTRRTGTLYVEGHRIIAELDLRGLAAPVLVDPDWTTTGTMTVAHWADFGFRRGDDKVMAVGGCALASCPLGLASSSCNQVLPSVDVWDPAQGTWQAGPPLALARYSYAGVVLGSGDLLVAGGCTESGCAAVTDVVERYSNAEDRFVDAGRLPRPVANATAALLPGGDAIVTGGCDDKACLAGVARYQAGQDTWTPAAALPGPRGFHTTTALGDGRVLVIGGCADVACASVLGDASVYDPATDRWRFAGSMDTPRAGHSATLLDDGTVLVVGGCRSQPCKGTALATSTVWRADAGLGGVFLIGPQMNAPRHHHTTTRLDNGELLVAGGTDGTDATRAASEIYMPLSHRFIEAPRMMMSRAYHVAVPLANGEVLVGGGCNPATCLPWAEVFDPAGLPVEVPDGGVADAGGLVDLGPESPPDWGAAVPVKGGPHPRLMRTGVTSCSTDETQDLPCPVPGWPRQDGEYQPNARALRPSAAADEVTDEATGLTWQAKDDGKTYTFEAAGGACAALSTPTTSAGAWRLPTVVELLTSIDYSHIGPALDQAFIDGQPTNYWTASAVAGSRMLGWTVKFDAGEVVPLLRDSALPIRCVRGAFKAAQDAGHLRLAGPLTATANTVRDEANVLEWQRKDDGRKRSWRESLDYCARLTLDGHDDWHLPTIFELLSLVEFGSAAPVKIDPAFDAPRGDIHWSSTFNEGIPTLTWSITFNLGVVDGVTITGGGYARCVRHLQPPAAGTGCSCGLGQRPAGGGPGIAGALLVAAILVGRARRRGGKPRG